MADPIAQRAAASAPPPPPLGSTPGATGLADGQGCCWAGGVGAGSPVAPVAGPAQAATGLAEAIVDAGPAADRAAPLEGQA
eukprot:10790534-Alexandrium_andersonii.AAC.1